MPSVYQLPQNALNLSEGNEENTKPGKTDEKEVVFGNFVHKYIRTA